MPQTTARGEFPDFKQQIDRAGKLDQVDPTVADLIVRSGLSDGDRGDDVVSVSRGSWPASSLKPSQTSMVLGKALGMALLMLKTGKVGGDLGALVSKDKHILDGHHRWAATILASGSKGKVGGYGANLPGADLLKVLNVISKGMFSVRGGKPGKGSLADFTPDKVRAMLEDFVQNGIGGEFPWSPESVQNTLKEAFGSVEAGVDQISKNASLVSKSVPSWAPDRKQMPVIEPEQVPAAANALNQGEVDWNDPHRKEGTMNLTASDRDRLIRLASSLPKGDESRRAILAGLRTAEKWIGKAVKHPGALHKALGIPEDKDIPIGKIKSELAKLDKKEDLSAEEKKLQKQLNFALTMKTKVNKGASEDDRAALIRQASQLPAGSEERRALLARLKG